MSKLYLLAFSSLIATVAGAFVPATLCLVVGFILIAILDPIAAKHRTALLHAVEADPDSNRRTELRGAVHELVDAWLALAFHRAIVY